MKTVLKILTAPVALMLSLLIRLCAALLSHAAFLFGFASAILGLLALIVLFTTSATNSLILLGIALAVSPIGLPMLAAKLMAGLQHIQLALKVFFQS